MPENNKYPKKQNKTPTNYRNQKKNTSVAKEKLEENAYGYNTSIPSFCFQIGRYIESSPHTVKEIREYIKNPQYFNGQLRNLAWWAYNSDGRVRSAVNYMTTMHTLDKVVVCKNSKNSKPRNFKNNRAKMNDVLNQINYKQQIRDNLMKNANDGTVFYYFEVGNKTDDGKKFLSDYEIANITEINDSKCDIRIIPLPIDYCRICGRTNNTYKGAFDLKYFDQFSEDEKKVRLKGMPKEIRDAYMERNGDNLNSWVVLNSKNTIITKVNSPINQPWGVPFSVTAFDDIMYEEYFVDTKRSVLDSVNNQILYMTFPEGKEKGNSSLSKKQQEEQHEKVKNAIINRKNVAGISFFSLASGTKLDKIGVDLEIFDEKNESALKDVVSDDLGIGSASLSGSSSGNYATASLNLELVASYVYSWIEGYMSELNKCINANIIKDSSCVVECYILPTTFANRDKQVRYMKELYQSGKGSLISWISACGFDSEAYISLMDYELESDFENKYPVHATSFTMSSSTTKNNETAGRSEETAPTNENTIQSKSSGSNTNPKPSTR